MNTNNIYSKEGELQYTPYVYQITIEKEGDKKLYIGSKTHGKSRKYLMVNGTTMLIHNCSLMVYTMATVR